MDYGPRYQLLDHAGDESPLWDCHRPITNYPLEGEPHTLHRERTPDELRPELEKLLKAGHVELFEQSDPNHRSLSLDEALEAIADDRNWFSPYDLAEHDERDAIYVLFLTDGGWDEFRREHARTHAS